MEPEPEIETIHIDQLARILAELKFYHPSIDVTVVNDLLMDEDIPFRVHDNKQIFVTPY